MTTDEAFKEIESLEFAARANVVSDLRSFLLALNHEPAIKRLYVASQKSVALREVILGRIHSLIKRPFDERYENPNDTPLAALLMLSSYFLRNSGRDAARLVADAVGCWYATRLAHLMLSQTASTGSGTIVPGIDAPTMRSSATSVHTGSSKRISVRFGDAA